MSTPRVPESAARDARFDAAMRAVHAGAVAGIGPRLAWQLRPEAARARQRVQPPRNWRAGLAFGGAMAALCALAIGMGLRQPAAPAAPLVATAPPAAAQDGGTTAFDQDPEFYAWLASDDADLVAVE